MCLFVAMALSVVFSSVTRGQAMGGGGGGSSSGTASSGATSGGSSTANPGGASGSGTSLTTPGSGVGPRSNVDQADATTPAGQRANSQTGTALDDRMSTGRAPGSVGSEASRNLRNDQRGGTAVDESDPMDRTDGDAALQSEVNDLGIGTSIGDDESGRRPGHDNASESLGRGRAHLGVKLKNVGGEVVVSHVEPGGAAEAAGIQKGDQIIAVNRQNVRLSREVVALISQMRPAWPIELGIVRNGAPDVVKAELRDAADEAERIASATKDRNSHTVMRPELGDDEMPQASDQNSSEKELNV